MVRNGADMVVTDNSFETVKEDDVKKIAQVEGIEEYNLITIATVVNPVNFFENRRFRYGSKYGCRRCQPTR